MGIDAGTRVQWTLPDSTVAYGWMLGSPDYSFTRDGIAQVAMDPDPSSASSFLKYNRIVVLVSVSALQAAPNVPDPLF